MNSIAIISILVVIQPGIFCARTMTVDGSTLNRNSSIHCDFDVSKINMSSTDDMIDIDYHGENLIKQQFDVIGCNFSVLSSLSIYSLKGIEISKPASPLLNSNQSAFDLYFSLVFTASQIDFLDANGVVLKSCEDYLKSYYN